MEVVYDVLHGHDVPEAVNRLQMLTEISRVVSSTLDLRVLYDTIFAQVSRVMDTSQFFIAIHDPENGQVDFPYHVEQGTLYLDERRSWGNSVTSLVIERGAPLLFSSHQDYIHFAGENGVPPHIIGQISSEAKMFVPLNTGSRTIGALSVQSTRQDAYSQDDMQALLVIASQAAVSIVNASLYEGSRTTVREMEALLSVARSITSSLDLQTVLDTILAEMRSVIPYQQAAVLLPDYAGGTLYLGGSTGSMAEERRRDVRVPFGQGVCGQVFESHEPLIVDDVTLFQGYISGAPGGRSEMAVPLLRGDTVVGVLDVERSEVRAFDSHDLDLLSLFASQAAIAIENARLFSEQQQRAHELQVLHSIVERVTPLHDEESIARVVMEELKHLTSYHHAAIWTLKQEEGIVVPVHSSGPLYSQVVLGEGLTGWVAKHGQAALVRNSKLDPRVKPLPGRGPTEDSILSVPLIFEERVHGVITLTKLGTDQFDENVLRLLQIIAGHVTTAFDRARLYEELRRQAITDELTGLYNHRYLYERYRQERSFAIRNDTALAVIMLDADKFKSVNDAYGHATGNQVLSELAGVLREAVRLEDIVARYGGEEFTVLVPRADVQEAAAMAERIRRLVASHGLAVEGDTLHLTLSVGVAQLRRDDPETELFNRADRAMYEAKRVGGNRVCMDTGSAFAWYVE